MTDESDCCGNGCANCILDRKPKESDENFQNNKKNIINNYSKFVLNHKVKYAQLEDVYELHFISCLQLPESADYCLHIKSGQHIMLRSPIDIFDNGTKKKLLRPYSPYMVDKTNLEFRILVNLKPKGLMSDYILNLLQGDEVEFRGPIGGNYSHKATSLNTERVILISQGVAIAPTLPIIEEILRNEDDMTRILHLACFTDLNHAYFRKELHEFSKFWNYNVRIYLSRERCEHKDCLDKENNLENCPHLTAKLYYKENVFLSRLNEIELYKHCQDKNFTNSTFVICGSRQFQNHMADVLKDLKMGAINENIFLL